MLAPLLLPLPRPSSSFFGLEALYSVGYNALMHLLIFLMESRLSKLSLAALRWIVREGHPAVLHLGIREDSLGDLESKSTSYLAHRT